MLIKENAYYSESLKAQIETEELVRSSLENDQRLHLASHKRFLIKAIDSGLGAHMIGLESSQPWIVYWILNSLSLLQDEPSETILTWAKNSIAACLDPTTGAFTGGPGQAPHLLTTFAAMHVICGVGLPLYQLIDRHKLFLYLKQLYCDKEGSFAVHMDSGERDLRGVYAALAIMKMTGLDVCLTAKERSAIGDFIVSCVTYEGGLGGRPFSEAHGGYSFCGIAALSILGQLHRVSLPLLIDWAARRQMNVEGGFQGRTNKLVDGCYSYWMGGIFYILSRQASSPLFDVYKLKQYLLNCCQSESGGLLDKPEKFPDYYHTCYDLAGLSIVQSLCRQYHQEAWLTWPALREIHWEFNLDREKIDTMIAYFHALHDELPRSS